MDNKQNQYLQQLSIFRVGEVCSVDGRTICIKVDKDKNLSHLLYKGNLIKNVSVGSHLKILKGFVQLVAIVESEHVEEKEIINRKYYNKNEELVRQLKVKLLGYFENNEYHKGVKELPLIGNVCLLMDTEEFSQIHRFASKGEKTIKVGNLLSDENMPIKIGINKLFTSHIGIFGNTGSGKSHTLATLYKQMLDKVSNNKNFKENAKFLLLDFNGEYSGTSVIFEGKKIYKCDTRNTKGGDKIPLKEEDILKPELVFILANATEKTQQPFIRRALRLYKRIHKENDSGSQIKEILKEDIKKIVCMSDHQKAQLLLDYLEQILPPYSIDIGLQSDLQWHGKNFSYYLKKGKINGEDLFFNSLGDDSNREYYFEKLLIYKHVNKFTEAENIIDRIIQFLYIQLIKDVLNSRAMNEHIAPAINKLKAIAPEFGKVFDITGKDIYDGKNFVVLDLNKVNLNMKKLMPLIVSTKLYNGHKESYMGDKTLNIIIDEAHNILSYESTRESDTWKDYRLETFEEIIKEGRKFGVFLTIASQRPSDISPTIISQLHTYFIHRLINDKDIEMVNKAISYLDKLSIESLPILPVGACVLSGVIADLPITIQVDELDSKYKPKSDNIPLERVWFDELNTNANSGGTGTVK